LAKSCEAVDVDVKVGDEEYHWILVLLGREGTWDDKTLGAHDEDDL
jgi:hypothetical protein